MTDNSTPPVPAATVLIVRDGAEGIEVFMVKRHYEVDFVAGALVFPGGKLAPGDLDAASSEFTTGMASWSMPMRALAAAAVREAFEESGILFARERDSEALVDAPRVAALQDWRATLERSEISLVDLLRRERLVLACDELVHFAHWVTPKVAPKRYDTHFFLARAPAGQLGTHGGCESIDSVWIRPQAAVSDREKWKVVFPTRLNLAKLARSNSVDNALSAARATSPLRVEPWVEDRPEGKVLRIGDDAGYEQTSALLRDSW